MNSNSIEDFYHWLNQFINFEKRAHDRAFTLEVISRYAAAFAHPQQAYKIVHIAGSKGKGSVAAMMSALLTEAGQEVGLYVSPHVNDFRERITNNGRFFSDAAYITAFRTVQEGATRLMCDSNGPRPSWFELLTLTAFVLFKQERMDWAVFETGMGGRLDATNIVSPDAVLLTSIELEHCEHLGDTLALIAAEKAGIIKENVPVFCSRQNQAAAAVFKAVAEKLHAPFFYLPDAVETIERTVTADGLDLTISFSAEHPIGRAFQRPIHTVLPFFTSVQAENALLASVAFKYLHSEVSEEYIERGLSRAWLPARFQVLRKNPLTVLDGAHTARSIETAIETFCSLTKEKPILVFACAKDKSPETLAPLFLDKVAQIYLTLPGAFKQGDLPASVRAFSQVFGKDRIVEASGDFESILKRAFQTSMHEARPLLITGSFYLAAEAQRIYSAEGYAGREKTD